MTNWGFILGRCLTLETTGACAFNNDIIVLRHSVSIVPFVVHEWAGWPVQYASDFDKENKNAGNNFAIKITQKYPSSNILKSKVILLRRSDIQQHLNILRQKGLKKI